MKHAEELMERLLFLDATPKMDYLPLSVGSNVKEGDDASRQLFTKLLADEEEHVDWLEAQVHQIKA